MDDARSINSHGLPKDIFDARRAQPDELEILDAVKYVLEKTKWPNAWVLFRNRQYSATLTPIRKDADEPFQLTIWNAIGEPVGDIPIVSLDEGVREAYKYSFHLIRTSVHHTKDLLIAPKPDIC